MKRILIINFVRNSNGVYSLECNKDTEKLKLEFEKECIVRTLHMEELPNLYDFIEEIISYNSDEIFFVQSQDNAKLVDGICEHLKKEYCDIKYKIISIQNKKGEYDDLALWRGTKAFFTGIYPQNMREDSISKHVYLDDITDEVAQCLSGYVGINHNIFHNTNARASCNISESKGYIPVNETSIIRENEDLYLCINSNESKRQVSICKYSEYKSSNLPDNYVALIDKKDFITYKEDIKRFSKTGVPDVERMWKPDFIDMCRFFNCANCAIDSLVRFRVENQGIYPCLTSNLCAGNVKDPFFKVSIHLKREKVKIASKRGCEKCERQYECSHCMALPDYLTEEEFCELMRDEINHSYLFKALVSLKFLYSSGVFDWDDKVRFVTPMNSILKKAPKRMTQFLLDKDTYLVCSQGKKPVYIIFSLKESKVFRVNENFFRLSELAARGYDVKEVIEIMGNVSMNSEKDIEEAFKETVSLLKKYKMME